MFQNTSTAEEIVGFKQNTIMGTGQGTKDFNRWKSCDDYRLWQDSICTARNRHYMTQKYPMEIGGARSQHGE